MKENKKIEAYYQHKAKYIVDRMYDKGYFSDKLSRDSIQTVEDLIAWSMQYECEMAIKTNDIIRDIKER